MDSITVKSETDSHFTLEGWAVVFGGKDLTGETFTKDTDFWLDKLGQSKPLLYDHGFDDALKTNVIGTADLSNREDGLWFEAQLSKANRYAQQVLKLAKAGVLGASSGAVAHLVRIEDTFLKAWPIAELSLTVQPAEPRTLGVAELRSLVAHAEALKDLLPEEATEVVSEQVAAVEVEPVITITDLAETKEKDMADLDSLDASVKTIQTDMAKFSTALEKVMTYLEDTPKIRGAGYYTVDGGKADPAIKSFGDWLLAVKRRDNDRLVKVYGSVKDLTEGDGTAGGFLVPTEQRTELLRFAEQASPILGLVTEVPVGVEAGSYPSLDQYVAPTAGIGNTAFAAGIVTTSTAEAAALTETNAAFKEINWQVHKIGGYTEVSNELIADSPTAIETLLRGLFGIAVASKREFYILRGTGVGEPLGILNAPAAVGVATNADNTFAWVDACSMLARFKQVTGRARWVMHQGVLPDLAAAGFLTGTTARRVEDLGYGAPILSQHMPQDDYDDVLLADFGCYLLFMRQPISIAYSEHVNFLTDKGTWRFTERLDGQPWVTGAITLADPQGSYTVSPFVYHDD